MILPDTSIWIDHLRTPSLELSRALRERRIVMHPFVIGEIALGSIKDRATVVTQLEALPRAAVAQHDEVMGLIERRHLSGAGIGYVDAHLLASAMLMPMGRLWTRDKRLRDAAERLAVAELEN